MLEIGISTITVVLLYLIFYVLNHISPKGSKSYSIDIILFFVGMFIRFIVGLGIIIFVIKTVKLNILLFAFSLMIEYMIFLFFEIKELLKKI